MIKSKVGFWILSLIAITCTQMGMQLSHVPRLVTKPKPMPIVVPQGWPKPTYRFRDNPPTEEGFALGKVLFYDPILSRDSSLSCASCHLSYTAFAHTDHALSHGIESRIGLRNAPTLANLAWGQRFMWDGAVHHLDFQALNPIAHPDEMDAALPQVLARLRRQPQYQTRFAQTFGDTSITGERMLKAFSQFLVQLVSANAKYDQVQRQEPGVAFTAQELNGQALFMTHCNSCHTAPLFTNNGFANNGLKPDPELKDWGRMGITRKKADSLMFKVPTLRNIALTPPYMHDGRFTSLSQVLKHYAKGIHQSPTLDPKLRNGLPLSPNEQIDLVAFLLTLTDHQFAFDKRFEAPQ